MGFWDSLKNIGKRVLQIGAPIVGGVAGSAIPGLGTWAGSALGGAIAKLAADKVTGSGNSALGSAIKGAAGGAFGNYAAQQGGGGFGGLWDTVKNPSNLWQSGGGNAIKSAAVGGGSTPVAPGANVDMLQNATTGGRFANWGATAAAPAASATTVAPVQTGIGGWIKNFASGMTPWQKQALLMQGIGSGLGAIGAHGAGKREDERWAEELRRIRRREDEIDRTRDYRREIMDRLENFQYPTVGV